MKKSLWATTNVLYYDVVVRIAYNKNTMLFICCETILVCMKLLLQYQLDIRSSDDRCLSCLSAGMALKSWQKELHWVHWRQLPYYPENEITQGWARNIGCLICFRLGNWNVLIWKIWKSVVKETLKQNKTKKETNTENTKK